MRRDAKLRKSYRREKSRRKKRYGMRVSGRGYVTTLVNLLKKRRKKVITKKRKNDRRMKGKKK